MQALGMHRGCLNARQVRILFSLSNCASKDPCKQQLCEGVRHVLQRRRTREGRDLRYVNRVETSDPLERLRGSRG